MICWESLWCLSAEFVRTKAAVNCAVQTRHCSWWGSSDVGSAFRLLIWTNSGKLKWWGLVNIFKWNAREISLLERRIKQLLFDSSMNHVLSSLSSSYLLITNSATQFSHQKPSRIFLESHKMVTVLHFYCCGSNFNSFNHSIINLDMKSDRGL